MDIHVCKQCGSHFVYCRACVFRPVRYKEIGFCSKECYEASKNVVAPAVIEKIVVAEEPKHIDEIVENIEQVEAVVFGQASIIEESTVAEPTIKKETNTYKNKKKKYSVHE